MHNYDIIPTCNCFLLYIFNLYYTFPHVAVFVILIFNLYFDPIILPSTVLSSIIQFV